MAISCFLVLVFLFSLFALETQSQTLTNQTDFSCDSTESCHTYVLYRAQVPEFSDLGNISDLFGVSRLSIMRASNLTAEVVTLSQNQQVFVPILCGCTGNHSYANISYQIQKSDSFYLVSTYKFENLTDYQAVGDLNPNLNPINLWVGTEVIFPIYCKCPSKTQVQNGTNFLITYVWQKGDNIVEVSKRLNTSVERIEDANKYRNFTAAMDLPVLIPVDQLPVLSQPPSGSTPDSSLLLTDNHDDHQVLIIFLSAMVSFLVLVLGFLVFLIYTQHKRSKPLVLEGSSFESMIRSNLKKNNKVENLSPRTPKEKRLVEVSDCFDKPVVYQKSKIMVATMNLSEDCRIGRSVYKAIIDGKCFAVKQCRGHITEEINIPQKFNHVNLVKLAGISMESEWNCFLVYEFAENGSLDKWLYQTILSPPSSISFLSWRTRLTIALDVANGLQYMHEHTRPSIVHRDIKARNILLTDQLKAKISNFATARAVTSSVTPKVDVYGFGVLLLELLSGRKNMDTQEECEKVNLLKELRGILEVEERREERLRQWLDPKLQGFYHFESALNLATMARACTWEKASERPSMAEIVLNLSVLIQSCPDSFEASWAAQEEATEDDEHNITPVRAR
ncbi:hypothetical protein AMTRI_Chr13g125410 [Amborella trichopoda]|uniref:non-specific serine/threonine protein kinase n=2 Tax=Amborella trichopoda TaxID=13333 RepID=U5D5W1_AMBTC|nr:hypothetical protein AMTR_s00059p00161380 [Amborella trichopoda]